MEIAFSSYKHSLEIFNLSTSGFRLDRSQLKFRVEILADVIEWIDY